jgi:predicted Zn finger-like uncharacterized protein
MKIICKSCNHEMALDEAKLPPLPFKVKCTKCGTIVVVDAPAEGSPRVESIPIPSKISPEIQEFIVQELAKIRQELFRSFQTLFGRELKFQDSAGSSFDGSGSARGNALICQPDKAVGGAISAALKSMGYSIEHVRSTSDAVKKLENESFDLISTDWSFPDDAEGGRQIIGRVNSHNSRLRRQIYLILITPDVKSGDPKSAFFYGVNLVLNPTDITQMPALIRDGLREEQEEYQLYQRLSIGTGE